MRQEKIKILDRRKRAHLLEALRQTCYEAEERYLKGKHPSVFMPDIGPAGLWVCIEGNKVLMRSASPTKSRIYLLFHAHSFYYFEGQCVDNESGSELVGRMVFANPQRTLETIFLAWLGIMFTGAGFAVADIQGESGLGLTVLLIAFLSIAFFWFYLNRKDQNRSEKDMKMLVEGTLRTAKSEL